LSCARARSTKQKCYSCQPDRLPRLTPDTTFLVGVLLPGYEYHDRVFQEMERRLDIGQTLVTGATLAGPDPGSLPHGAFAAQVPVPVLEARAIDNGCPAH
jgi:hypothetical protein